MMARMELITVAMFIAGLMVFFGLIVPGGQTLALSGAILLGAMIIARRLGPPKDSSGSN